jgi:hypothetical protein
MSRRVAFVRSTQRNIPEDDILQFVYISTLDAQL